MPRPTKQSKTLQTNLQSKIARITPNQKQGISALPSNLLLEISHYFLVITVPDILANPTNLSVDYRERFYALKALSQTCKRLRIVCLPLAWERLEACTAHGGTQFFKEVGIMLERKSSGMLKCDHLLSLVRIVTVTLTRYQTGTILPVFAKCLASLPNLHTIQVVHAHSQMTTPIKNAFKGIVLSNVQTVIMPSCAHEILRCCPNVKDVTCNEDDGLKLAGALCFSKASKLNALRNVQLTDATAKKLAKIAPDLQVAQMVSSEDGVRRLAAFKKLSAIHLTVIHRKKEPTRDISNCIQAAQDVLRKSCNKGEKQIRVFYMYTEDDRHSQRRVTITDVPV